MHELKEHWNKAFLSKDQHLLGWYEEKSSPSLSLIRDINLDKDALILHVGAGVSTLTGDLNSLGYENIILTDISDVALEKSKELYGNSTIQFIQDDLTKPVNLRDIPQVDLWHDRAVLHFFKDEVEQQNYFQLLKEKVKCRGYVIFAEFEKETGATRCSNLDVFGYNTAMLKDRLGNEFKLIKSFPYTYLMPGGAERPYIYALFQRQC